MNERYVIQYFSYGARELLTRSSQKNKAKSFFKKYTSVKRSLDVHLLYSFISFKLSFITSNCIKLCHIYNPWLILPDKAFLLIFIETAEPSDSCSMFFSTRGYNVTTQSQQFSVGTAC